jgi:FkbM family methyltransferase
MQHLRRIRTIAGHTFFPRTLTGESIVVDLGANRCEFSRAVRTDYRCRCFAVEPSPKFAATIPDLSGISTFNYALAGHNGIMSFNISTEPLSSSMREIKDCERTVEVMGRTLAQFMRENQLSRIDLLKIDIEGAEIDLFDATPDEELLRIGQITVEFHDFCGLISRSDVQRVWMRLEALGFSSIRFSASNHNCVFIRRQECGVGFLEWLIIRYFVRYVRGALVRIGPIWMNSFLVR